MTDFIDNLESISYTLNVAVIDGHTYIALHVVNRHAGRGDVEGFHLIIFA
jgi:hypothetical protein